MVSSSSRLARFLHGEAEESLRRMEEGGRKDDEEKEEEEGEERGDPVSMHAQTSEHRGLLGLCLATVSLATACLWPSPESK